MGRLHVLYLSAREEGRRIKAYKMTLTEGLQNWEWPSLKTQLGDHFHGLFRF